MRAEDWQRVESIYHEATALPADRRDAFLDRACGGDAALRAEVESLLDHTAASDTVFEAPAMNIAAQLLAREWSASEASRTGTTLGHLRIGRRLGAGGMGIVYEADDVRLGRKVAVKFLPPWIAATPSARDRFAQEARAASALNHPHICTIHAVHEIEGQPCIEMELLEGRTLRERMAAPLSVLEVLTVADQVSDALEAAHAKRIVHRDLKPANIFLTPRGAKVLDFGIAVLGASADPSVAGTPAYMSPEQFTGGFVDARSDLFSLGAVLEEISAGRAPAALQRIITRLLDADPDRRYQSAADLRCDLAAARRKISGRPRRLIAAAGVTVALLSLAGGWYALLGRNTFEDDLRLRQITHNTSEYRVSSGAISPDGRRVAYADPRGLHVIDLETNATKTVAAASDAPAGATWDVTPGWLRDGRSFVVNAVIRPGASASSIWMATLDGPPSMIRDGGEALAVSPDGQLIAFTVDRGTEGERSVWLMDTRGNREWKAFDAGRGTGILGPTFSPDSRRLAYGRTSGTPVPVSIDVRDIEGGAATTILAPDAPDVLQGVVWLQDGRLLYSLYRPSDGTSAGAMACSHWQMRVDDRGRISDGPSRLAGWLPQCVGGLSFTADSRRALLLQWAIEDAIRIVDPGVTGGSTRLTATAGRNIPSGWTPDGGAIVFISDSSGRMALYRQDAAGHTPVLLRDEPGIVGAARLTPDGSAVIYLAGAGRNSPALKRVSIDGGDAVEIARGNFVDGGARCATPPATLCAVAERTNGNTIEFRAFDPSSGVGAPLTRIETRPGEEFRWALSPDATRIAALDAKGKAIRIIPLDGSTPREITVQDANSLGYVSWTSDGSALIVPAVNRQSITLRKVSLDGVSQTLFEHHGALDMSGIPAPDGKRIAAWVRTRNASLWLAESP